MRYELETRALGIGTALAAAALIFVGVPEGVVSPAGGSLVLRPDFWPTILGWLLLAIGIGIALVGGRSDEAPESDADDPAARGGLLRLAGLAMILLALALGIEMVGMVWASVLAFWAMLLMIAPRRGWIAALVGLALPLLLYAFFAKFAGVPIPQGDFVRLP